MLLTVNLLENNRRSAKDRRNGSENNPNNKASQIRYSYKITNSNKNSISYYSQDKYHHFEDIEEQVGTNGKDLLAKSLYKFRRI